MRKSLAFLFLVSCGKVVGDLPIDGSPGGQIDAGGPLLRTIRQIRTAPDPDGTRVGLKDVVVVGKEFRGQDSGVVYVQDAAGGDNAGIQLFCAFGASSECNLTKNQFDTMAIGQILDLTAEFDEFTPQGTPTPLPVPRLIRAMVSMKGTMTLTPRTVLASMLKEDQLSNALLWSYVKVVGPIHVIDAAADRLEVPCPNSGSGVGHRGVQMLVAEGAGVEMLVAVRPDPQAPYCLFECGVTCAHQLVVDDHFASIAGVPDTFYKPDQPGLVLLAPQRATDIVAN